MIHKNSTPWVRACLFGLAIGIGIAVEARVSFFQNQHSRAERAEQRRAERQRDRDEVVAEYLRRQAIANANNSETATNEPTQNDAREGQMLSRPYEGMTLKAAQAAARKNRDWHRQNDALRKSEREYSGKLLAHVEASVATGHEKLSARLAALSLLSPEQLDYARQALLKTQPADDVDALFHAIVTHPNTTTPKPLKRHVQKLLKSLEIYNIVERELDIEREAIRREREELKRTRPF